jgi:tetratricopeptide (TPR) repeat protein
MEYGRSLTSAQVNEERQKVVATIKKMETEGRISVRKNSGDDFLDWEDMDMVSGLQKGQFGKSDAPANGQGAAPAASAENLAQAPAYVTAGGQMYTEGKYAEALSYLQYAVGLDPNSIDGWTYLGNAYYALGQSAEALAAFERVLALNPGDAQMKAWVDQFRAGVSS